MYWCGVFKSPEIFTTILTKEPLAIVCMYDLPCILFLNKSNSIPFNYSNLIFFFLIFHRLTKTFYLTKPMGKIGDPKNIQNCYISHYIHRFFEINEKQGF